MIASRYQRIFRSRLFLAICLLSCSHFAVAETAADAPTLIIKDQAFTPQTLTIPAGVAIKIMIKNDDVMPAEFESNDLGKEKVIPGGTTLPLYLQALKPGTYQFFNDFHPASIGTLVAEKTK